MRRFGQIFWSFGAACGIASLIGGADYGIYLVVNCIAIPINLLMVAYMTWVYDG